VKVEWWVNTRYDLASSPVEAVTAAFPPTDLYIIYGVTGQNVSWAARTCKETGDFRCNLTHY
jgi:hypothetical protein